MKRKSRLARKEARPEMHRLDIVQHMSDMSTMFYASWYRKDVSPHMTRPEKEKLLKKISDYSLEHPMAVPNVEIDKKEFPELAPFMHTEKLSGLQLYAVMSELFYELHPQHRKAIPRPYPQLPF